MQTFEKLQILNLMIYMYLDGFGVRFNFIQ